uniref:non-specific serine/threonine protein kinase n=1 Tax=Kalanchoe fedtschenkoi TaxID=63787 RepID=A0A7N0TMT6_KALFE
MRILCSWASLLLGLLLLAGSSDRVHGDNPKNSGCGILYSCGDLRDIGYPFWGADRLSYCGHPDFKLECLPDGKTSIIIRSVDYLVMNISSQNQTLKITRWDYLDNICPVEYVNTTVDSNNFNYSPQDDFVTLLYDCQQVNDTFPQYDPFSCGDGYTKQLAYMGLTSNLPLKLRNSCKYNVVVPVLKSAVDPHPEQDTRVSKEVLNQGFEVVWRSDFNEMCDDCELSDGHCGYDLALSGFICLCGDGSYHQTCAADSPAASPPKSKTRLSDVERKLIIGFGVGGGTVLIMCAAFFIYLRYRKAICDPSSYYTRNISSDPSSITDHEKMGAQYGVKFFTYEELEKATDNFNQNMEIGDGGFGTVYRGVLQDGRIVAVKRLYENNYKRVEQFLNEVEILTRLRHRNLVTLYGCTSRHSRELLLVYEYISNGTVGDHLHGRKVKPGSLSWQTRLKIAVETASALKYLHASDIIHRDVKTNNILLDDYFNVKVADFGLSRLFPLHVTHVSTAPQGTPGYVDPEYHQCYQLTDKSDVYSFGVVLVELISSKPAVDITRHRHEINLSNMAINKIQNDALHELVDPALGYDKDPNAQKMIAAVAELAFQCLQSDKDLRPSMQEVLDILTRIQCGDEEKAEELEILSDEFVLLKSGSLPLSPDSVTVKWVSNSTAAN